VVRVVVGYLEYAELYHLRDVVGPLLVAQVVADGEGTYLVVAVARDVGVADAAEDAYEGEDADGGASGAHDGADGLLRQDGAVEARGRIEAVVAVAAVGGALLAEVAQEDASPADAGFGEGLHACEFLEVDGHAARLGGELAEHDDVGV